MKSQAEVEREVSSAFRRQQLTTWLIGSPFVVLLGAKAVLQSDYFSIFAIVISAFVVVIVADVVMMASDRIRNKNRRRDVICVATGDFQRLPKFSNALKWGRITLSQSELVWRGGFGRRQSSWRIPLSEIKRVTFVKLRWSMPLVGVVIESDISSREVLLVRFPNEFAAKLNEVLAQAR